VNIWTKLWQNCRGDCILLLFILINEKFVNINHVNVNVDTPCLNVAYRYSEEKFSIVQKQLSDFQSSGEFDRYPDDRRDTRNDLFMKKSNQVFVA
jgi:hypothetical protein